MMVALSQTQTTARTDSGPSIQILSSVSRARSYRNSEPEVFSSLHDLVFRFQLTPAELAARYTWAAGQPRAAVPHGLCFLPGHSGVIQPVIVHAVLDKKGHVVEAEALQHSDSMLSDAALAIVERSNYAKRDAGRPVQREAFINVQFVPPQ